MPISSETLSPAAEQALGALLVTDGLITSAQLLAVQQYSWQHKLDLRQALLKLKLVPPDQIAKLVSERVPQIIEAVDENLPVLADDPERDLSRDASDPAPGRSRPTSSRSPGRRSRPGRRSPPTSRWPSGTSGAS